MTYTDIDKQVQKELENVYAEVSHKAAMGRWVESKDKFMVGVKNVIHQIYTQAKAEQREEDINSVMYLIDGNYDNPNLAGDIEETFGITFQEWCKKNV